ncbi:MAG TPA: beta galactosidase jelly roll domain-containing protein, partial [Anaerolineaceae bacterium]|nr:beta galactosidase jelly roll domain-containing protein [Anaerolineaceae bacterium]
MLRSQPLLPSLANRRVLSLNGEWAFQLDPAGELNLAELAPTQTIPVPLPWQALSPEMRAYKGYAWYTRSVDVPADFLTGEALLRFGAVDYWCEVFVNGVKVGEHEGGFTPFTLPVGRCLTAGQNTVTVRVFDPILDKIEFYRWAKDQPAPDSEGPFAESEVPHGKQEWYVNIGGIWQDVTLEAVPAAWMEAIRIQPDVAAQCARVSLRLAGQLPAVKGSRLVLTVRTAAHAVAATASVGVEPGVSELAAELALPEPRLWSLEDPHLYSLHARLETPGGVHEKVERFGMRTFETRSGQFLLNGQPVYLLAALDQDFYPETVFTVPSEAYLRDQFRKAKE